MDDKRRDIWWDRNRDKFRSSQVDEHKDKEVIRVEIRKRSIFQSELFAGWSNPVINRNIHGNSSQEGKRDQRKMGWINYVDMLKVVEFHEEWVPLWGSFSLALCGKYGITVKNIQSD